MTVLRPYSRWWAWATPVAALVVALIMPLVLTVPRVDWERIELRNAEVEAAIEAFPRSFGEWRSRSADVPAPAIDLLRPNAVLARRYERLAGGAWMDFLVVHCSDVRDMEGHYPPRCYPANGWRAERTNRNPRIKTVLANGYELPLRIYEFRRHEVAGNERWLRVFNVFLLPDGRTTADYKQLRNISDIYVQSVEGVAQLQIITPGHVPVAAALDDIHALLDQAGPLLDLLRNGASHDHFESAT